MEALSLTTRQWKKLIASGENKGKRRRFRFSKEELQEMQLMLELNYSPYQVAYEFNTTVSIAQRIQATVISKVLNSKDEAYYNEEEMLMDKDYSYESLSEIEKLIYDKL